MARMATLSGTIGRRLQHGALLLLLTILLAACSVAERRPAVQPAPTGGMPTTGPAAGPATSVTDRLGRPISPETVRVALLLPLSGNGSDVGAAMLRAAEMAVFDIGADNFELLPRDTRGTPDGAAAAARMALDEGADLMLGPLFASSVRAVQPVAASANVNVLAFTTDSTAAGGNVYVMGFTPAEQVDRVVAFSSGRGLDRFALLAPASPYGEVVANALRAASARHGGRVTQAQIYEPDRRDFSEPVQTLAAAGDTFDAIMLPDSGLRLLTVAPFLPYHGLRDKQVLGTGLWDGAEVGSERALVGAWFAAPDPALRRRFEGEYRANFGEEPPRLATLAYDAVALAAVVSRMPGGAAFSRAALADPSGFAGLDGIFRFGPDNVVERGLAVLEVTQQGAEVIDAAPQSFAEVGF